MEEKLKNIQFLSNLVHGASDTAFYEFADEFSKFKMADRVRRTKVEKLSNLNANWYPRFL